jgi:hypothetical protein
MSYSCRGIVMDDEIKESIDAYVFAGRPTGGFLEAVIDNNLREAIARADERRLHMIPAIVAYFYNECDMRCWGSAGKYKEWLEFCRAYREAGQQRV